MERTEDASRENRASVVRDEEAVARFVERFALTFSEAGVPRMPARVFSALLVSDEGRRTASELAETLKVSPAAVSNAVRYLTQVGLVAREREPGERRDHYRIHGGDTWYEVTIRRDAMLLRWQEDLREGIEAIGADTPAGKRLEETRRFYQFIHEEMPRLRIGRFPRAGVRGLLLGRFTR